MNGLTEIRWHARAGQGAKTASQVLALALLRSGKFVQAFPEYGPERRGAPLRAYTRSSSKPIRRHDAIEHPDAVVVLEPCGAFIGKVFAGGADASLVAELKRNFKTVKHAKPPASRKGSSEWYVVAQGFKGRAVAPAGA